MTSEADEPQFDFNAIIPLPAKHSCQCAKDSWGTKWNSYGFQELCFNDARWEVQFDTAWTTPFEVFQEIGKQFPSVCIDVEFADPLESFYGAIKIEDGKASFTRHYYL